MGTSQVQGVHLPLNFLMGDRYRHINFKMAEPWGLDAVEYIPELFRVGEQRAAECFDWVNEGFFPHRRTQFTPVTVADNEIQLSGNVTIHEPLHRAQSRKADVKTATTGTIARQ